MEGGGNPGILGLKHIQGGKLNKLARLRKKEKRLEKAISLCTDRYGYLRGPQSTVQQSTRSQGPKTSVREKRCNA